MSHFFLFNVSKEDFKIIHQEIIPIEDNLWNQILNTYDHERKTPNHRFLFLHCSDQRIFVGFDEILYNDESQSNTIDNSDEEKDERDSTEQRDKN
jgi:hypothetical protein